MILKNSNLLNYLKFLLPRIFFLVIFFASSVNTPLASASTLYSQLGIGTNFDTAVSPSGHAYANTPAWTTGSFYGTGFYTTTGSEAKLQLYRISGNACNNIDANHNSNNGIAFLTSGGSSWGDMSGGSQISANVCQWNISFATASQNLSVIAVMSQNTNGGIDVVLGGNSTNGNAYWDGGFSSPLGTGGFAFQICDSGGCNQSFAPVVENITSDITTSTTWHKDINYIVSGGIEITTGDTLTIEPGTRIKFDDTTSSSLTVNGVLDAIGSASLGEIFFTSNASTPSPGDWGGIIVGSGGEANFDYATISYAGKTGGSEAGIYNDGGTISITNSGIVYSENSGVKNSSGTTTIDDNTDIGFNDYGIYKDGGTITVSDSVIHDNSLYGVYNNTVSSMNAENNYWGDSSGPDDFGPGSGDNVSDYVDFDPWTPYVYYDIGVSSVNNNEIRWDGSTQYSDEFDDAVTAWNALGNINIAPKITTADLTVSDVSLADTGWAGLWNPIVANPDTLKLNEYYLDNYSSSIIQNVITHELGHALGLGHSFTGNVMYFVATPQTSLGSQDTFDYYYLWP